ncbi:hypothetical protein CAEBREN_10410 [Caenorhabditis brenneri]|uniref:Uncharacterized protein n=1 Tax=Caenorhabditis brenneri TaxID=135651 RepID=G0PM72_CAEBE|nr:hypothetical protein CAEBREN_10410 [Caenorhabditis brenneri]
MVFIEHLRGGTPRPTTTVSPILCLMNWNDEQCRQFKSYIPKFASNFDAPRHAPQVPSSPSYDYEEGGVESGNQEEKKKENDHGIADRSMNDVSGETTGKRVQGCFFENVAITNDLSYISGFFSPVLPTVADIPPSTRQSEREF